MLNALKEYRVYQVDVIFTSFYFGYVISIYPLSLVLGKSPDEVMGDFATPLLKNLGGEDRLASDDKDLRDWRSVSGASSVSNH